MFRIIIERDRRLLRVETSGLGTVDEVAAFSREREATLDAQGWADGEFLMLMDTTDTIAQPQVVIQALENLLHRTSRKPYRLAVVKRGAIAGMQTRRILTSDHAAHFANVDEAENWLLGFLSALNRAV